MKRLVSQGLVCDSVSPIESHTLIQLYLSFGSFSYEDRINPQFISKANLGPSTGHWFKAHEMQSKTYTP